VAEVQRERYLRTSGVGAAHVETVPNGVETSLYRLDPGARARLRMELDLADETPLFVTVAMLRPGKGVQHLLEAAALLRGRAPEARWLIVGDGPERAELEDHARALGLANVAQFLGTRLDVAALLAAADVYVHPSLFEALPMSVLEAMAASLPVVATRVGGVPELVAEGQTGLLVPAQRADALADAMARMLDPGRRAAMGAAGRVWVEQHASTETMLDRLQDLYRRVLARRTAHRPT
jgi:glycosyltransferase involved in cell wall biosynthesis